MEPHLSDTTAADLPCHPFSWLPPAIQGRAFVLALLLTLALMAAILVTNSPLINPTAPSGMVSFQLAGTLSGTGAILASWNRQAQLFAALNLGIDYLYMFAYAVTLGLGCVLLARRFPSRSPLLALLGAGLSWGMLAALLLDAAENYFLIRLILGDQQTLLPVMARWCAIPKFALVLAALAYLVGGGLLALILNQKRYQS